MSTPASNSFSVSRSTSFGSTAPTIEQPSAIEIAEFTTGFCALASRRPQSPLALGNTGPARRVGVGIAQLAEPLDVGNRRLARAVGIGLAVLFRRRHHRRHFGDA